MTVSLTVLFGVKTLEALDMRLTVGPHRLILTDDSRNRWLHCE